MEGAGRFKSEPEAFLQNLITSLDNTVVKAHVETLMSDPQWLSELAQR